MRTPSARVNLRGRCTSGQMDRAIWSSGVSARLCGSYLFILALRPGSVSPDPPPGADPRSDADGLMRGDCESFFGARCPPEATLKAGLIPAVSF